MCVCGGGGGGGGANLVSMKMTWQLIIASQIILLQLASIVPKRSAFPHFHPQIPW